MYCGFDKNRKFMEYMTPERVTREAEEFIESTFRDYGFEIVEVGETQKRDNFFTSILNRIFDLFIIIT